MTACSKQGLHDPPPQHPAFLNIVRAANIDHYDTLLSAEHVERVEIVMKETEDCR